MVSHGCSGVGLNRKVQQLPRSPVSSASQAGVSSFDVIAGAAQPRRAPSIGELNERSLHRALKARYAAGGNATEQAIDGFVADVVVGDRIVEVHTGSFAPLKRKLPPLLARHPVTLVYPIARDRYIVKTANPPSAPAKRRMSPKHGSVLEVFSVLVSIPALLAHPNLTLEVVLTVEEEVRAINRGRSRWRQAWVRADRRLVDVVATHVFASMADLFATVDAELPERFTTGDLAAAMGASRRLAGQAAFCFREGGVSEVCGKRGNTLVYRRARAVTRRALTPPTGPASPGGLRAR